MPHVNAYWMSAVLVHLPVSETAYVTTKQVAFYGAITVFFALFAVSSKTNGHLAWGNKLRILRSLEQVWLFWFSCIRMWEAVIARFRVGHTAQLQILQTSDCYVDRLSPFAGTVGHISLWRTF